MLLAREPVQFPQLVPHGVNSNSSVRRETEDINLLSSVKKMAITPKFSPPKKIMVSPPSPKNSSPGGSGTSKKKGRAPLFGESDLQPPLVQATTTAIAKFSGQGKGDRKGGGSSYHSPVRRHSASSSSSIDKKSIEEVVRANLKSMRDASSSSANGKGRKFDVNHIARTAVKSLRSSKIRASLDGADKHPEDETGRPKSTNYGTRGTHSSLPYYNSDLKRSGIPRSLSMKGLEGSSASSGSGSGSEREDESPKKSVSSSLVPWSSSGTNTSTTDFQAACKARVLKKQKEMLARLKEQSLTLSQEVTTGRQESQRLRREETAMRDKEKHRKRKEIYAVNAYLKEQEQLKFKLFLKTQKEAELEAAAKAAKKSNEETQALDFRDDVSWCSNDSSLMPTPRYRNEKERNYQAENVRKSGESSASESDSERSGNGLALPRGASVRQSVGGGV